MEDAPDPALGFEYRVHVEHLLASAIHRYEGRPSDGPRPAVDAESVERITVRAHLGIVGDRHFGKAAHRSASVTIMAVESVEHVERTLGLAQALDPLDTRRNILIRGVDVDRLRGADFTLDSGAGPVLFHAHRPANPCAWMDVMLAPGAHKALRGRGGLRCEPLTSGQLARGPALLRSSHRLDDGDARLF
ncbi:MOSC domain-containing protein [Agreia sp.]|uniref:MOSC domain-containing protein n=1 Tax=Agreia sp. TaxID=1872416 RepID=UPI0035BBB532